MHIYNGMSAADLTELTWQRARRSSPSGNCVELAQLPGAAGVAMRNSRDPMGPALIYTLDEIAAFLDEARAGELDFLIR
jgi:hypothetical protein